MAQSAELLKLKQAESLPPRPTLWSPWLADGLASSTLRLQRLGVQGQALLTIVDLLRKMNLHVQFHAGIIFGWLSQQAPYPAFPWEWKCVQQYKWKATQHICVVDLLSSFEPLQCAVIVIVVVSRAPVCSDSFRDHSIPSRHCTVPTFMVVPSSSVAIVWWLSLAILLAHSLVLDPALQLIAHPDRRRDCNLLARCRTRSRDHHRSCSEHQLGAPFR